MNITGKHLFVNEIKEENGRRSVNLGDSKKNADGTYSSFNWFGVAFYSDAKDKPVAVGDKIEVTSGQAWMQKSASTGKYYLNMAVFHFDIMETKAERDAKKGTTAGEVVAGNTSSGADAARKVFGDADSGNNGDFEDDLPF